MPAEDGVGQGENEAEGAPGSERIIDEGSLEDRVPLSEEMLEEKEEDDMQNKSTLHSSSVRKYIEKTELLHADEEFLN
jgi:hypothetical protein